MQTIDHGDLAERVRRYARKQLRDDHAAEDVAQDVMVKLLSAPQEPRQATAWALRAARYAIIDRYRRSRHAAASLDTAPEPAARSDGDSTQCLADCAARMVDRLAPEYRDAVKSADFVGATQPHLPGKLGLSRSGMKSRVQRGRRKLAEMIQRCCDIDWTVDGRVRAVEPTHAALAACTRQSTRNCCVHCG